MAGLHLTGNTVFTYLPNSIHASIDQVGAIPASAMARTLVLGVCPGRPATRLGDSMGAAPPGAGSGGPRPSTRGPRTGDGDLWPRRAVLFATGFDWVRWFADCGAAWLIVAGLRHDVGRWQSGRMTETGRPDGRIRSTDSAGAGYPGAGPIHLSRWLPALAVYLAAVPPLDVLFVTDQLRHFLLFV